MIYFYLFVHWIGYPERPVYASTSIKHRIYSSWVNLLSIIAIEHVFVITRVQPLNFDLRELSIFEVYSLFSVVGQTCAWYPSMLLFFNAISLFIALDFKFLHFSIYTFCNFNLGSSLLILVLIFQLQVDEFMYLIVLFYVFTHLVLPLFPCNFRKVTEKFNPFIDYLIYEKNKVKTYPI